MNELSIFDSLFNRYAGHPIFGTDCATSAVPRVDVLEDEKSYTLEMELPGRSEDGVDIQIEKGTLTISSREDVAEDSVASDAGKSTEGGADADSHSDSDAVSGSVSGAGTGKKYLLRERRLSEFSRSFGLPEDVDAENVTASFRNGVLSVVMGRKEKPLPRKISITAA